MWKIDLHGDPSSTMLRLDEVADYLCAKVPGITLTKQEEFVSAHLARLPEEKRKDALELLAIAFAKARVHDHTKPVQEREPLYGEIAYERRRLTKQDRQPFGVVYDGFIVQAALRELMPPLKRKSIVIAFTNQLLATFDEGDNRYHLRTLIVGYPALISTTGLVEAPAKPREFYLLREQARAVGAGEMHAALEHEFADRCLLHGDERLTEVAKGYVMQAFFYAAFGEGFCSDKNCRLYNAHWQEEMLRAQLNGDYEFCPRHEGMLQLLVEGEHK